MDLLDRARTLMACSLFESLAPAVLIRLAERARADELARGERRTTDDTVWVVATGSLAVAVREAAPMDATAVGDSVSHCSCILGFAWNGTACVELGDCACVGADCDKLTQDQAACAASHATCS